MLSFNGLRKEVEQRLATLFPYKDFDFQEGFKYLGFVLKPNMYGKSD